MGGFNTISIVPFIAIPPSFGNTQKTLLARNEIPKKSKIIAPYYTYYPSAHGAILYDPWISFEIIAAPWRGYFLGSWNTLGSCLLQGSSLSSQIFLCSDLTFHNVGTNRKNISRAHGPYHVRVANVARSGSVVSRHVPQNCRPATCQIVALAQIDSTSETTVVIL